MERTRQMTYAMIEAAVTKGIRDIQDNLRRGIRNFVDLGSYFAAGQPHQSFFQYAQYVIKDYKSSYYQLVAKVINNIDHRIVKRVGINLGYNSWTYGAKKIRQQGESWGYNVPWSLIFDFRKAENPTMTMADMSALLSNAESLGIYCSIVFAGADSDYLRSLLATLPSLKNQTFFVFTSPSLITHELAQLAHSANNIGLVLEFDSTTKDQCRLASQTLLEQKCLYGTYTTYNQHSIELMTSSHFVESLDKLKGSFAFLVREEENMDPALLQPLQEYLRKARGPNGRTVFMIDFYDDLAYVSNKIAKGSSFFVITDDGHIRKSLNGPTIQGINTKTHSLKAIAKTVASCS